MVPDEISRKFHIALNKQQLAAIEKTDGPVLLLAVPGSGKTTVLVLRLGHMILDCGIRPDEILTLTYTVAACGDMKRRFAHFFGEELASHVEFRTLNGISARVIYEYSRRVGRTPFQLCTDEKQLLAILSGIYRQVTDSFPQEADLKLCRTLITYIKNQMLTEEEVKELDDENDVPISRIYKAYRETMRQEGLMDYDDQMVYALHILRICPELLGAFQNQYRYLCVDEAQDTSRIQHEIIKLLSAGTENLFMVGDEDQSIYGFRAAYPEALLHFSDDHPGADVLLMEENYRSQPAIAEHANRFIQKNKLRHKKSMHAVRENPATESVIETMRVKNRAAQYTAVAQMAKGLTKETAVLYRDNESAVPLVDLLLRKNIPFRMRSVDATFFTHRTVLDVRSLVSLALNPTDTEAFRSLYYKLGLYLNKSAAERIAEMSQREGLPVLKAALCVTGLPPYSYPAIKDLKRNLARAANSLGGEAFDILIYECGYADYLMRENRDTGKIALLRAVARREDSLESFLERLDMLHDEMIAHENDPACPLVLSTIHASKGLEYDTVWLLDLEDGIFPESVPSAYEKNDPDIRAAYEEERRLFYVGTTRAKEHLVLLKTAKASTFHKEFLPEYYSKVKKDPFVPLT